MCVEAVQQRVMFFIGTGCRYALPDVGLLTGTTGTCKNPHAPP